MIDRFYTCCFYVVMACYLVFLAYVMASKWPQLGSPALAFPAVGAVGLLMIFRPWQGAEEIKSEGVVDGLERGEKKQKHIS